MRRLLFVCGLMVVVSLLLAACGGGGFAQTVDTASYRVQLNLDGADFNEHTATITVQDKSGQAAAVDQVVVAPIMEAMGMASPEQTAQPLGGGRYEAKGTFFSMLGDWEFDVRITSGGKEEVARFTVPVQQQ
jgi:YtkA-like protein